MRWMVIGLGVMGDAITRRLHDLGNDVIGVDPLPAARSGLEGLDGVRAVASVAEAGPVDLVAVMVRTPPQVIEVLEALRAVRQRLRPEDGPLPVLVLSTLDPHTARRLAEWDGENLRVIEAPVTGLAQGARQGTLTIMLAGRHDEPERSALEATLAQRLVTFERFGQPALAKLLNNTLLAYNSHALAAALRVAAAEGLPPRALMDVLLGGSGGSFAATNLDILIGELVDKDVGLLVDALGDLPAIQPGSGQAGSGQPVTPAIAEARRLLAEGAHRPDAPE